jgi:hypothetical protein
LPTTQVAGIQTDADIDRNIGVAAVLGLDLALLVQPVDPLQHVERGFAGVELMFLVVERRIPERHDGVAHIFVDGALSRQDRVGQRRQEPVHQRGQALRIMLVGFRDGGEAPDVGEHDGHLALFAAKLEFFRRLRELLDQGRRQILAERRADLPPLRLLADEAEENQGEIDRRGRQQRIGEIDQQQMLPVKIPGGSDQQRCKQRADGDQRDRSEFRRERDHQKAEQQRGAEFEQRAVRRLRQQRLVSAASSTWAWISTPASPDRPAWS